MKQKIHFILKCFFILGILLLGAQEAKPTRQVRAQNAANMNVPSGPGGGQYLAGDAPDLTPQQRDTIQNQIDANIQHMQLPGLAQIAPSSVLFAWPVRAVSSLNDSGYHSIAGYVDHNPAYPNQLLDYNCGQRTYDQASGYNHGGTDIFTWPFGWYRMDNNQIEAVAAAPGTIVLKQDGNFDRSCAMNNNTWNAVFIRHVDGTVAWYGHLKKGSLTTKPVGATVAAGEFLGVVGSSGSSTGPHLHFEVHDANGNVIDPYSGTCNARASMWTVQRPYNDSAINSVMTGSAAPVFPTCPAAETTNAKDAFLPGDTIYFTAFYRDQLAGQVSQYTVFMPDGTPYQTWTHSSPDPYYSASYWYWSDTLGPNVPSGIWKFQVVYNGQTYAHNFTVDNPVSLHGQPRDRSILLSWDVLAPLDPASTWQIDYTGPAGDPASPINIADSTTRSLLLTNLTNYTSYTINLRVLLHGITVHTTTISVMPTDIFVHLPFVTR